MRAHVAGVCSCEASYGVRVTVRGWLGSTGCNAAPGHDNVVVAVSAKVFGQTDFYYFLISDSGDMASEPYLVVPGPYSVTGRPWFQDGLRGGGYGSPYALAGTTRAVYGRTFTYPVFDEAGIVHAVILADYSSDASPAVCVIVGCFVVAPLFDVLISHNSVHQWLYGRMHSKLIRSASWAAGRRSCVRNRRVHRCT